MTAPRVLRFPGEQRRPQRKKAGAPWVLDAAPVIEAAQVLEAELRDVRRSARAMEAALGLLLQAVRDGRAA